MTRHISEKDGLVERMRNKAGYECVSYYQILIWDKNKAMKDRFKKGILPMKSLFQQINNHATY